MVMCLLNALFLRRMGKQADYGRTKSNHGSAYPDAEFVLIDCKVKNIIPEGWSSIGAKTAKMYEYNTCDMVTGNPVDVSKTSSIFPPADKR